LRAAAAESSAVIAAATTHPVIPTTFGDEAATTEIASPAIAVLTNRELRQRAFGLDAFRPWQRRANQRTMNGTLLEGWIIDAWGGHGVGV
jgi:hypothetical protein